MLHCLLAGTATRSQTSSELPHLLERSLAASAEPVGGSTGSVDTGHDPVTRSAIWGAGARLWPWFRTLVVSASRAMNGAGGDCGSTRCTRRSLVRAGAAEVTADQISDRGQLLDPFAAGVGGQAS